MKQARMTFKTCKNTNFVTKNEYDENIYLMNVILGSDSAILAKLLIIQENLKAGCNFIAKQIAYDRLSETKRQIQYCTNGFEQKKAR